MKRLVVVVACFAASFALLSSSGTAIFHALVLMVLMWGLGFGVGLIVYGFLMTKPQPGRDKPYL